MTSFMCPYCGEISWTPLTESGLVVKCFKCAAELKIDIMVKVTPTETEIIKRKMR